MASPAPLKAMVLAAGAGTRLQPLSFQTPKPMAPVAGLPVLHHVLNNLARHGVREAMLNLHSHPEQVRGYCGDGSKWNMKIRYSHERRLLGTAGGVKKVESFFKDSPFIIMSGDGLCNIDITRFYRFHRARRSLATLASKAVDSRFEYGVALTHKTGRIRGFLEKPNWGDVLSNQVNTGIYLFEPAVFKHIPKGVYDFGHQLWPKLLKLKKPIYAWEWKGYWCDIGNLTEYRKSQKAALDGEAGIEIPGKQVRKRIWMDPTAQVHPRAKLQAPCVIGKGAQIARNAHIGPYTVVGAKSSVGEKAVLKNCILLEDVRVGAGAHLSHCILCANSKISTHSAIYNAEILNTKK